MKSTATCFMLPLALLFSGNTSTAAVDPSTQVDIMEVETLDEVVVKGNLTSLSGLRAAIIAAEDRFYARWNELNADDQYDIQCRVEAPTGRRMFRRSCAPRVVDDLTHAIAMGLVRGNSDTNAQYKTSEDVRLAAARELKRRTLVLLDQDPELRQALLERARLSELYKVMEAK